MYLFGYSEARRSSGYQWTQVCLERRETVGGTMEYGAIVGRTSSVKSVLVVLFRWFRWVQHRRKVPPSGRVYVVGVIHELSDPQGLITVICGTCSRRRNLVGSMTGEPLR